MKNQSQVQKRSTGSNVLIIVLILITLATSAFGIFAWARYQTTVQGESTAQVAKWNFKVTGDKTQTEQVSFLITRTDNNQTVAEGTIAPGTYGEIPIEIDVTGTQTDLVYIISGSVVNLPRNIKLYSDSARTQEIVVADGEQFSKGNYLKIADIGNEPKVIAETIYWEWPFETGITEGDKESNNIRDTEDMGKPMTMALTVEGKQLNGAPVLADVVQVGDYVNYSANSNGEKTFTSDDYKDLTGINISGTISTQDDFEYDEQQETALSQWRVLSVDRKTKEVSLISVGPTSQTVKFLNGNGFVNAEILLNNICKIYDDGKGAKLDTGRSITEDDIDKYSSYDKKTAVGALKYGESRIYTGVGDFYKEEYDEEGNVKGYEPTLTKASQENPIKITSTYYSYKLKNSLRNNIIYDLLTNNNTYDYWIASRATSTDPGMCSYGVRYVRNGGMLDVDYICNSQGIQRERFHKVRPVISLEKNIQTTGKNANGVWELKVD